MATETGTLERLSQELGLALTPLEEQLTAANIATLFLELGLDDPPALGGDAAFVQKLGDAVQRLIALGPQIEAIAAAADSDDAGAIVEAAVDLLENIVRLGIDLEAIATDLERATAGTASADAIAEFAREFAERLLGDVAIRYFETSHPLVYEMLSLLTVIEATTVTVPVAGQPREIVRRRLHLDRVGRLFSDPLGVVQDGYGWGREDFDGELLLRRISSLFDVLGPLAVVNDPDEDDPATLDFLGLTIRPTADAHPPGLEAELYADLGAAVDLPLAQFGTDWRLVLSIGGQFTPGLTARLLPPSSLTVIPQGEVQGDVTLRFIGAAPVPGNQVILFGETAGTRLQAQQVLAGLMTSLRWNVISGDATADVGMELKVVQGKFVITTTSADGFLKKVLPADGITLDFDFTLGWSQSRGFYFTGSGGFETTLAVNVTLGPIHIDMVHLRIGVSGEGLQLEVTVDAGLEIGPVAAAVERIGIGADLAFSKGNLGPVDLGFGFKPPTGLGVAVDAGPVSGGGFVSFDEANHRYSGILKLEILSVSVTVIGLVETRLPDGREGYSFLLIVCVEFSPIQLGFGFTLNGVGGLAGIHRGMNLEALRTGVYTGSLDHILFPQDPIANAPQLISDLSRIFPVAEGQFTFGPMAKLGWGAGDIITISLGIIIELPSPVRIALLGQIGCFLPEPEDAIVELHIDFVASIDFEAKLFALDATLRDSRIVVFTLTGDMAMRLCWGDQPSFAFALGGFHPHFPTPPGFPALRRLTLALGAGDWIRLTCQTYQAVTSNSLQFGARLELYVDVGVFIHGWLGFDALIIFSPFSFQVDFTAGLELAIGSIRLASISVEGSLSGPTPWRVRGEATISLLFFEVTARVDEQFGRADPATLPTLDPWPDLLAAAEDARNWAATLPPGVLSVVSLAAAKDDTAVLIDPGGRITWREHVAPLDRRLTRYQSAATPAPVTFTVDRVTVGVTQTTPPTVDDFFAPAQFEELNDAQKLSRPSFEKMHGGVEVTSTTVRAGAGLPASITYETKLIDTEIESRTAPPYALPLRAQLAHTRGGPAARSPLANGGLRAFTGDRILTDADERFDIASTTDFTRRVDITASTTKGAAWQALDDYLAEHPGEAGQLQVVPVGELEDL